MRTKRFNGKIGVAAKKQLVIAAMKTYNLDKETAISMVADAYKKLDTKPEVMVQFNYSDMVTGDAEEREKPIDDYVNNIFRDELVVVPTWSTYSKDISIPAPEPDIVAEKMSMREKQKALAFEAKMRKDMAEFEIQYTSQVGSKTISNSISGAVSVGGTSVQNPTSHHTLTSTARLATSTTNGCIERLISGIMHFKDANSVWGYLTSIIAMVGEDNNYDIIETTMSEYNLVYPDASDVMDLILESSKDYWVNKPHMDLIEMFISNLKPVELAAIYYNGSLYNLNNKNPELITEWLRSLVVIQTGTIDDSHADALKKTDPILRNSIHHIFNARIKGLSGAYSTWDKQLVTDMYLTALYFKETIDKLSGIIDTFIKPIILAPNVGDYKEMVRNCIVVNDTDSGIFHLGDWMEILLGRQHVISSEAKQYMGVFVYITNLAFTHALDIMSLNMNVHLKEDGSNFIEMESELSLDMLALPSGSKHYWGEVCIAEGNVLPDRDMIKKGAGLRNASTPVLVKQIADDIERDITVSIEKDGHIDIYKYLDIIVSVEEVITEGAKTTADYYRTVDIKSHDSQNWIWAEFWNNTKLGKNLPVDVPTTMIKIPTTLTSKAKTTKWLEEMSDRELASDIKLWMQQHNKVQMPRMYLPKDNIVSTGIPDFMLPILSPRELVLDICGMFYIILSTLAIYKDPKMTLSEVYTPGETYPFVR